VLPRLLIGRQLASIEINGILVGFKDVPEAIQRFCVPALFYKADQPEYDVFPSGSALLLRYRGRNFAICTLHQTKYLEPRNFQVLFHEADGRRVGAKPDRSILLSAEKPDHANMGDIAILEYDDERNGRDLRQRFLRLDLAVTRDELAPEALLASFSIGYPTYARDVEFPEGDDAATIISRGVVLYLADSSPALMDEENRRPMVQDPAANQPMLEKPDGMSGAPVFCFWSDERRQVRLSFVGMITSAKNGRFAVYQAGYIRQWFDHIIDNR
jgi:hypothetical protein